jgi:N-acetylneuraminic acid mutarotase
MTTSRENHTATLLQNGQVLVVGGATGGQGSATTSTELYDSVAGTWSSAVTLTNPRVLHTATLLPNGKVTVIGGSSGFTTTSDCCVAVSETYDPTANAWSVATSLAGIARESHIAALLPDGTVLVAGGYGAPDYSVLLTTGIYDPLANTWSDAGSISSGGPVVGTQLSNGAVWVAGGETLITTCTDPMCRSISVTVTPTASAQIYWP